MKVKLEVTNQFRKDYKRMKRRGYDTDLLESMIQALLEERPIAKKHRDHPLTGDYGGFRECHILPDWLLIYAIMPDKFKVIFLRTGTHSDLF